MAVDPRDVTTSGIRVTKVLHDDGADGYSVARIRLPNGATHLGIRWNGESETADGADRGTMGYPTSRGKPVFFTVPDELEGLLSSFYRE